MDLGGSMPFYFDLRKRPSIVDFMFDWVTLWIKFLYSIK
jgi:hypothetical protein